MTVNPDQAPTVSITAPLPGSMLVGPSNVLLTATASSPVGVAISKVVFADGGQALGTATKVPYQFAWRNAQPGTHAITATVTDALGLTGTASLNVTINQDVPPSVGVTAVPATGFTGIGPETLVLTATVTQGSTTVTSVAFSDAAGAIHTITGAGPYVYNWTKVAAGSYVVTATAKDQLGTTGAGSVAVSVAQDPQPVVAVTLPAAGSTVVAGSTIVLNASATSSAETIKSVAYTYNSGANKIGTSTKATTYPFTWPKVAAGTYNVVATATDALGTTGVSPPLNLTVVPDQPASVTLLTPISGANYASPGSIELSVNVTPFAGTKIMSVTYYHETTKIATVNKAPFAYNWKNVPAGTYSITATATDNLALTATSNAASITVAASTTIVKITAPASNTTVAAQGSQTITASVTPSTGVQSVSFYAGNTLLGTSTSSPYQYVWQNIPSGIYYLTAVETTTTGATLTSAPINFTSGSAPVVTLTSPSDGASFVVPATINLSAAVTDAAHISSVQFFFGGSLIGTSSSTSSPYQYVWSAMPANQYQITAVATDVLGQTTTSAVANITVLSTLPYVTDFEVGDGFLGGPVSGQNDWNQIQGSVNIQSASAYSGSQSLQLAAANPVSITQTPFAQVSGETVVFCDFYALPVAEASITNSSLFTAEQAQFGFVQVNGQGVLEVFAGNGSGGGTWTATTFTTPLGTGNQTQGWIRLTARLDFTKQTWDMYANGAMVQADIPFISNSSTYFSSFQAQGDASTDTFVDTVTIQANSPLFADANNDGIDDAWEAQYGLSLTANDRYLNISGDGIPIIQDFIKGASPYINTQVTPLPVQSGVLLHLQADAGIEAGSNGAVSQWLDQSGNGNNAFQTTASMQPTLAANQINGLPSLSFNGTNALNLPPNMMQGGAAGEIIGVVKIADNPGQFNMLWNFGTYLGSAFNEYQHYEDFGSNSSANIPQNPNEVAQYFIYDTYLNANGTTSTSTGTVVYSFNGIAEWTQQVSGTNIGFQYFPDLGGFGGGSLIGNISEVMVFNRVLNSSERNSIGTYLMARYAFPSITVPTAPTDVLAVANSQDSIDVSWTASNPPMHTVASIMRQVGLGAFVQVAQVNDGSSFTDTNLTGGVSYSYQVVLQSYAGTSGPSNTATATTPSNVSDIPQSGLSLWLRSTAGTEGSGAVQSWVDQSGQGNNAVAVDPNNPPTLVEGQANGLPVVRFAGTNSLNLPGGMFQSSQAAHVIAVVKIPANANQSSQLWEFGTGGGSGFSSFGANSHFDDLGSNDTNTIQDTSDETQYFLYDSSIDSGGNFAYLFNGNSAWTKVEPVPLTFSTSPQVGPGSLTGDVAEIIVYNRVLSQAEQGTVYAYLDNKFGLSASISNPNLPAINSTTNYFGQIQQPFQYTITATNSPVSFGATGLPGGLTVVNGVISGVPTDAITTPTVYPVVLSASNSSGTGYANLALTIYPAPQTVPVSAEAGATFTYQITSSFTATSYSTSTLPAWLSFNSTTGVLSGTPPAAGILSITVTATGAAGSLSYPLAITTGPNFPVSNGIILLLQGDTGIQTETLNNVQVPVWKDQSGLGNDAVQLGSYAVPTNTGASAGGHQTIHFSGSQLLDLGTHLGTNSTPGDFFIVLHGSGGAWTLGPYGANFGTSFTNGGQVHPNYVTDDFLSQQPQTFFVNASLAPLNIYNASASLTQWTARFNGTTLFSTNFNKYGVPGIENFFQGGTRALLGGATVNDGDEDDPSFFTGDIAEVILYNRILTDAERATIGQYLQAKYALGSIIAPPAASGLTATSISGTQVYLAWKGNAAPAGTRYSIQRQSGSAALAEVAQVTDSQSYLDTSLTPGTSYTYEVVAMTYAGASSPSNSISATTASNGADLPLDGMKLWLRSDAGIAQDNGSVFFWGDQSGSGNNAYTRATYFSQTPTNSANAINGLPVVHFASATISLSVQNFTSVIDQNQIITVPNAGDLFIVARQAGSNTQSALYSFGTNGALYPNSDGTIRDGFLSTAEYNEGAPIAPLTTFNLYNASASDAEWTARLNGSLQYETTTGSIVQIVNFQTPYGTLGSNGDVAEVLAYTRVLSDSERFAVGQYLQNKYNLPNTVVPSAPTNLTTAFATFGSEIILSWTPSANAAAYLVQRSTDGGPWETVGTAGNLGTPVSFTDEEIPSTGNILQYQVQAQGYKGSSTFSALASTSSPNAIDPVSGVPYWLDVVLGLVPNSSPNPFPSAPTQPTPTPTPTPGNGPLILTLIVPSNATLQ